VRAKSWFKAAVLTAAVIVFAAARAAADAPADDLQTLQTSLNSSGSTAAVREEAARTLVERGSPEALDILRNSFQTPDNQPAQLAIARALQLTANPDPSFIPLLGDALGGNLRLTQEAAAALANYRNNLTVFEKLNEKLNIQALPDGSRVAIATAMGSVMEQEAARSLMGVLQDQTNSEQVRAAAADALGEMTGLYENGQDLQRWQLWWDANKSKSKDQWQADLLASLSREAKQIKPLKDDIQQLVRANYSLTSPDRKESALLRYLGPDPNTPEMRMAGADLVAEDFEDGRPIPDSVHQRLRELIDDSDPDVRNAVIDTLGNINDQEAAPALIAQLGRENDVRIRLKIAAALGRMNNLSAVPVLLKMLDDTYFAEASAAADALAKLGDRLRQANPQLAREATDDLQKTLDNRSADPSAGDLRVNCVAALAELADPRSLNTFLLVLKPGESDAVHIAALRGLQNLKDPNSVPAITEYLKDPNPAVQLQAAEALENLGNFDLADQLYGMLGPPTDPHVQDAVWKDLQNIFKNGSVEDLNIWPDHFKDDPEKRLVALQALRAALVRENKDPQVVADEDQDIGDTLKQLTPKRLDEAVQSYKRALDYWSDKGKNQPGGDAKLDALVGAMLDTLLLGRKYSDAADFGAKQLNINKEYESTVGAALLNEAARLKKAGDTDGARQLIEAALKIPWPQNSHYPDDLKQILDDLGAPATAPAGAG
jgi:HEAT repeat protein